MILADEDVQGSEHKAPLERDLRQAARALSATLNTEQGVMFIAFVVRRRRRHVEDLTLSVVALGKCL